MVVKPAISVARRWFVARATRSAEALVQHLVVPRRLVVGVQQDVRVPFDQPRHQRRARQVDDRRAGRGDARRRPDGLDAIAAHAHRPALVHRVAVEHARGLQHRDRLCVARGGVLRPHRKGAGRHCHQQKIYQSFAS